MKKQVIIVEEKNQDFKILVQKYLDKGYTVAKLDISSAVATNCVVKVLVAIVELETEVL